MASEVLYQDNFNRTNGNLNGSTSSDGKFTWSETQGTALAIETNSVYVSGNVSFCAAEASKAPPVDCYAQFTIADFNYTDYTLGILR